MIRQLVLTTRRLCLRPLQLDDAPAIQEAASAREIADTMISLPHPYPGGEAGRYLARLQTEREAGRCVAFSIEKRSEKALLGIIELRCIDKEHAQGELSFWITVNNWGRGFMSEAVQEVVRYAFAEVGLNRLYAYHMTRNPSSGRVLQKNGFRQEGLLYQRVRKWGQFEDVALWALLRQEWWDRQQASS